MDGTEPSWRLTVVGNHDRQICPRLSEWPWARYGTISTSPLTRHKRCLTQETELDNSLEYQDRRTHYRLTLTQLTTTLSLATRDYVYALPHAHSTLTLVAIPRITRHLPYVYTCFIGCHFSLHDD